MCEPKHKSNATRLHIIDNNCEMQNMFVLALCNYVPEAHIHLHRKLSTIALDHVCVTVHFRLAGEQCAELLAAAASASHILDT